MSFYDDASLVVITSAQKTSKLYAVKPTDGSGDLAFTRTGDTATRVNSAGLVEKVRTNVVTYSQDFSDASWTKTALTISTSATANPVNGALTAQDAIPTAVSSTHRVFKLAGIASAANTWSIYAKAKGYNFITIVENGNTTASVSFNLSTGAVSTQNSAVGQIQSLGNGWYRCSMIHTTTATPRFDVYVSPTDSLSAYTADGTSGVTLFGAQAEASDFGATPYIATTTAAVSVGPVANVPRLDYLGSTCPRLILEGQRTNLVTYSEQLNNAAWTKTSTTVTANAATSPDGYQNADLIVPANGVDGVVVFPGSSFTSGTTYTLSAFGKKEDFDFLLLAFPSSAFPASNRVALFNLNNGTIASATQSGTGAIITDYGNGWYRCSISIAATMTTTGNIVYGARSSNSLTSLGNGTDGVYIWGAQLELGAQATSYIPTLAASATRGADFPSKSNINALIGGTSGTVFFEIKTNSTLTSTNYKQFFYYTGASSGQAYMYISNTNVLVTNPSFGSINGSLTFQPNTIYKIALAYAINDFKLYINGVARGTSTSGTPLDAVNLLSLGSLIGSSEFNEFTFAQYLHFKTRLTNAELAELTTL